MEGRNHKNNCNLRGIRITVCPDNEAHLVSYFLRHVPNGLLYLIR